MAIAGFVSRADWGARKPESVSRNIDASRGGVAVHYGGAGAPPSTHAGCIARWKSWQDFHMKDRGWVDIAYNFGFCNHGYVFAGRGLGVRSAANGTNDANLRFLAACWIGGGSHQPTKEAYEALDWIVAEARKAGAAPGVRPHGSFKSTACPGVALTARARQLNGKAVNSSTKPPSKPAQSASAKKGRKPSPLPAFPLPSGYWFGPDDGSKKSVSGLHGRRFKGRLDRDWIKMWVDQLIERGWSIGKGKSYLSRYGNDGKWGAEYTELCLAFQDDQGLREDGGLGKRTWDAASRNPIT